MKESTTGDTLCDAVKSVVLETMTFPDPVIEIAIEPKSKNDQKKCLLAYSALAAEDPSFQVSSDIESDRQSCEVWENCLDILVDRLKREFKVEAILVRRKWLTVKPLPKKLKWITPQKQPADRVSLHG